MRRVRDKKAARYQEECLLCDHPIMIGQLIAAYEATEVGEDFRDANAEHAECADREEVESIELMYDAVDELDPKERARYLRLNRDLQRFPELR